MIIEIIPTDKEKGISSKHILEINKYINIFFLSSISVIFFNDKFVNWSSGKSYEKNSIDLWDINIEFEVVRFYCMLYLIRLLLKNSFVKYILVCLSVHNF